MKKFFVIFSFFFLLSFLFVGVQQTNAADIRSNQDIILSSNEQNLEDMYLFGSTIKVDAPITNDLVTAGGDIDINNTVTGNVLATGGNLNIRGTIGNNVRIAGGNILIDGPIERDLVVTGGSVTVTQKASIGGDVLFAGGNLDLQGPVQGKLLMGGGHVTINNTIGKNVDGEVGKLILGPKAAINGNLSYKSTEKAILASGAVVKGKQNYTENKEEKSKEAGEFFQGAILYKLLADIVLSVLFVFFFGRFILPIFTRMTKTPVQSGAIGFAFFALIPVISAVLLILIWLGVASFLFYGLSLIVAVFLTKIFVGWNIMKWWEKRNKKNYTLDWKAGVIGPFTIFLLLLIPVLGWLAVALLFFVSLGSLTQQLMTPFATQKSEKHVTPIEQKKSVKKKS